MSDADTAHRLLVIARELGSSAVTIGMAAGACHDDASKLRDFDLGGRADALRAAAAVLDQAAG